MSVAKEQRGKQADAKHFVIFILSPVGGSIEAL